MKKLLLALGLGLFSTVTIARDVIVDYDALYHTEEIKEVGSHNRWALSNAMSTLHKLDDKYNPLTENEKLEMIVESLGLSLSAMEVRQRKSELLGRFEEALKKRLSIILDTEHFIFPYTNELDKINLAFYPAKIDKETLTRYDFSDNEFFENYDVEKGRLYSMYDPRGVMCEKRIGSSDIEIFELCNRGRAYIDMSNEMAQELILDRKKLWRIVATVKLKNEKEIVGDYLKATLAGVTIHFVPDAYKEFKKNGKSYYSAELKFEQ